MIRLWILLGLLAASQAHAVGSCAGTSAWSQTASANNAAAPCGWPTGLNPADVKLVGRQGMADVRAALDDIQWINPGYGLTRVSSTAFAVGDSNSGIYQVNRRVKLGFSDLTTYLYGTIVSTSYAAPSTTVIVTTDSGSISTTLNKEFYGAVSALNSSITSATLGLQSIGTPDTILSGTTSVAAISATSTVSVTTGATTASYFRSAGLVTAGISTTAAGGVSLSSLYVAGDITPTGTLNGATLVSTSSGGIVSGTYLNGRYVSATSISLGGASVLPIQAAVSFNGAVSPVTINRQVNVASVAKTATGQYTITYSSTLANSPIPVCMNYRSANSIYVQAYTATTPTTAGFSILTNDNGSALDAQQVYCIVY
jgi:hypothetical protein